MPKLTHDVGHKRGRASAYPNKGDALDAIFKGFVAIRDGQPLPPELLKWLSDCEAVKKNNPKKKAAQ